MNDELRKIIKKRGIHPISYTKKGKVYIIKEKKHSFVIKLNTNNYDIYKYLLSRDFLYFPENFSYKNSNYDIYEYIPDIKEEYEQKLEDLIIIISKLHSKTSYRREIDLDDIKSIYEDTKSKIEKIRQYYVRLNDSIDKELFLSPVNYLLARNISLIYYALDISNKYIDEWYKHIIKEKGLRVALLHNNISIDHLIIDDKKYLISWDYAYFNNPIYDIENFYRKYYYYLELQDVLQIYEKNNKLYNLEYKLLFALLLIPKIIDASSNSLLDIEKTNNEILYLNKVITFLKNNKEISEK